MGSGVFVSYRKLDDPGWAGRVRDALARHFGADRVFFDVESIRGGQRWEDALGDALDASGALVLVIGPHWLARLVERQGTDEVDHHLREITTALDRGIAVFPVRVHGAPMPSEDDLPEELRTRLPALQWREIYDTLFEASVQQVIADVEGAVGAVAPSAPVAGEAGSTGRAVTLTVGPRGTDADHHEIADAVAQAPEGATVRVLPGRYLQQVRIERPVTLVADGRGEVLLDTDAVPCLRTSASGVVIAGIAVRSSARTGAVGIEVVAGECALEDLVVSAKWPDGATGISVGGAATRAMVSTTSISSVEVGIHLDGVAAARIERTSVARAGAHALLVSGATDPKVSDCRFEGAVQATVRFDAGAHGTLDGCAVGRGGGPTIELAGGADPTIRGGREGTGSGAIASVAGRIASVRSGASDGPAADDRDRRGWLVRVVGEAAGTFLDADLDEVVAEDGATTRFVRCGVALVRGTSAGRAAFEACTIARVVLDDGAHLDFDGCTIEPPKGVKVTVEVRTRAHGTFRTCDITGRNVRDGSPDPAVLVDGGAVTLRECTVRNPGEGVVWTRGGGTAVVDGGELRSTTSGPALVVADGGVELVGGAVVRGGVRLERGASLQVDRSQIEADSVSGVLIVASEGSVLEATRSQLRGPGLAAARKVGRWIEARTDRTKGKVAGALGSSPPVRIAAGADATFTGCSFTGIGGDGLVVPTDGVAFRDTTVDGTPRG